MIHAANGRFKTSQLYLRGDLSRLTPPLFTAPVISGSYHFRVKNTYSKKQCLIPLDELLRSPDLVADDCCVFGVDILKIDVFSPEKKAIPVQKNATTVQSLFIQNSGFMRATCTFAMDNFLDDQLKYFVSSPTFVFDNRKWYFGVYPHGDLYSINCISLYLHLDSSDDAPRESGKLVQLSLSILDQKHGKHFTKKTPGLVVFVGECDGLTSYHSIYYLTRGETILWDHAVFSGQRSLSWDHPLMVRC